MPETLFWNIPKRVMDHLRWLAEQHGTTPEEEFLKMRKGEIRTRIEYAAEAERRSRQWREDEERGRR